MKAGAIYDAAFEGKLEIKQPSSGLNRDIQRFHYQTALGTFTFNWIDRIEAYFGLGVTQQNLRFKPISGISYSLKTHHDFAYQVGGKVLVIQWPKTVFGLDAKYTKSPLTIEDFKMNGSSINSGSAYLRFRQWQVGGALAHRFGWFIPYTGLTLINTKLLLRKFPTTIPLIPSKMRLRNRKRFIYTLGTTFTSDKIFTLSLEGRFFAETGISATADIRF